MPEVVFRTLTREYRVACPSAAASERLAFLAAKPEIVDAELTTTRLAIVEEQAFLRLDLPNGPRLEGDADHIMSMLHGLVFEDILRTERGGCLVHCATVVHPARPSARLLVVGHAGSGKTTLTLRLLDAGYAVEGDEHYIVWPNRAIARPRTLRVKSGSLAHVPRLAAAIVASPHIAFPDGAPLYAVDPSIAGRPWRIAEGNVEHVFFLEAESRRLSHLKPIGAQEGLRRLLANRRAAARRRRSRRRAASRDPDEAGFFALLLGDLDRGAGQIAGRSPVPIGKTRVSC